MADYEFYFTSSLEKVFPTKRVKEEKSSKFNLFKNERLNLQLVYSLFDADIDARNRCFNVNIEGDIDFELFDVNLVKCEYLATENRDRFYIDTNPGLYPDLLTSNKGLIKPLPNQFKSLWIALKSNEKTISTNVKIKLEEVFFEGNSGKRIDTKKIFFEKEIEINVVDYSLPELPIKHTQWFHSDSIANYHKVDVFSEEHWALLEKYIDFAANRADINMLLTPVFTPSLDTDVDKERLTVQLVDIFYKNNKYEFNFDKLKRWCDICKKCGIKYIEVAHFFTQWGAMATPKIIVSELDENNNYVSKKKFGWHVKASDKEYRKFLEAFIPSLIENLDNFGYPKDKLYFHISDEPNLKSLESYAIAKNQVKDLLKDCNIIDALSDYSFYENKLVEIPIPSNDHIEPFVNNVEELWTYYCIAQGNLVPNRFIALESSRNRIMGILMYLYNIKGFLHWGYNYYESENSRESVNPFITTDGNCAFPAGDPFLVYPGPLSSIRNEVQVEGFNDLKLLYLVEEKIGRDKTIELIKEGQSCAFSFKDYPRNSAYLITLRNKLVQLFI